MLGPKLLLFIVGSVSGATAFSSTSILSLKDWDPSYVWRLSAKDKFFLTSCWRIPNPENLLDQHGSSEGWFHIDMWVYLTLLEKGQAITNNTKLQLRAEGYFISGKGSTVYRNKQFSEYNLQETLSATDARFNWTEEESGVVKKISLITGAQDVHNQDFESVLCKELFNIDKAVFNERNTNADIKLNQVQFTLSDCKDNKYKNLWGCSITISSDGINKKLDWGDGFKNLVVIK
ncbi:hypothetical protein WEN_00185 [Mycoplasma wenyonii str. Massachusetts]|uniref:Uncharacterized protein n=1 Tax=Mycoplasma wenyonii (strain Massachusetts) TaxID=1197325 RepID=I6YKV3_MYCWM|nr:hypothetical protein [Mycoplasma wenyonii]AFN64844.1 hypothetical protein WEN_00185 [Mycoplasma wenyonii str. Massachusetts]